MGLGPPVCQHCKVYARFSNEKGYYCKYCGETDITSFHEYMNGDTKYLEENEKEVKRFYNFWRKKNDTTID